MSNITKQDTNGVKPLLAVGELGYDNYPSGGDAGRVWVGTGSENIALAKKTEVTDHTTRTDNPHSVTKTQVGLSNVDNTSDVNKPVSIATQNALNNKVDKVAGKGLSTEDYTSVEKTKLAGIEAGAQVNMVASVAGKTGIVTLVKGDVGLGSVDNTSDASKPVSTAAQTALDLKANKSGNLSQFGSTSSSELAEVISDETGTGKLVFATSPTLVTPNIGVAIGTSFNSITGLSSTTPLVDGTASVGTGTTAARADHKHPTDTTRAPLASPIFTGTPTAPTAAVGTSNTVIATTEFVNAEIANDAIPRVVSRDNAIVRFDGTTGAVQNSSVTIDDNGNVEIGNTLDNNTRRIRFTTASGGSSAIESATLGATAQDLVFKTTYGIESEKMRITGLGNVLVTGGGGLGYGTGSGGTVTQLTSKSTAVTLNKPSGQITTSSSALGAGVTTAFILNNTLLTGNDNIKVIVGGGGAAGAYQADCTYCINGAANITIKNLDSTSRTDAVVINFTIIKGANS